MKKVAAYVRVSTAGQNPESQKKALQNFALVKFNNRDVVWFEDKATGNHTDRPGFASLQSAIFKGEIDTVMVYKLDRISRKLQDGVAVLGKWVDDGIRVVSVSQQIDFDGPLGKMFASVMFAVAEMEQQLRKDRQADGIEVAKAEGKYKGRKAGTFKADRNRVKELQQQGIKVKEIAAMLGVTPMTIYRYLKEDCPS